MSKTLSTAQVIGRLGKDPELTYLPSGKAVCKFSLATNHWVGKDQPEITDWHNIVCWERTAETANEYLRKGSMCFVSGRLQSRKYLGKDDQERTVWEIVAQELILLDPKGSDRAATGDGVADDDEIPF